MPTMLNRMCPHFHSFLIGCCVQFEFWELPIPVSDTRNLVACSSQSTVRYTFGSIVESQPLADPGQHNMDYCPLTVGVSHTGSRTPLILKGTHFSLTLVSTSNGCQAVLSGGFTHRGGNITWSGHVKMTSLNVLKLLQMLQGKGVQAVTRSYYRNAACVILLFDLTSHKTFESIQNWHQEVTQRAQPHPLLLFLLLGTKSDIREQRSVPREDAQDLADSISAPYLETSARTGSNVSAALSLLCRELLKATRQEKPAPLEHSCVGCSKL
ncbi:unnamed protein product [Ranitomeya imitator]|uniref:Uncharacterized protein n=1 Tax=Ranitomeya imitator TaxID=111125 RepID=A0ABN9KRL3_9NEOB|nr:unnamed protein product [Ranitomeya imitator]